MVASNEAIFIKLQKLEEIRRLHRHFDANVSLYFSLTERMCDNVASLVNAACRGLTDAKKGRQGCPGFD